MSITMALFAWYYPKLGESTVWLRLLLIALSAVVIILYARRRWGTMLATGFVTLGLLAGVTALLVPALGADFQGFGDFCREANRSTLPDWFFAAFIELDV